MAAPHQVEMPRKTMNAFVAAMLPLSTMNNVSFALLERSNYRNSYSTELINNSLIQRIGRIVRIFLLKERHFPLLTD